MISGGSPLGVGGRVDELFMVPVETWERGCSILLSLGVMAVWDGVDKLSGGSWGWGENALQEHEGASWGFGGWGRMVVCEKVPSIEMPASPVLTCQSPRHLFLSNVGLARRLLVSIGEAFQLWNVKRFSIGKGKTCQQLTPQAVVVPVRQRPRCRRRSSSSSTGPNTLCLTVQSFCHKPNGIHWRVMPFGEGWNWGGSSVPSLWA